MNEIHTLADYIRELPGIGPRQAKRLAYYLVRRSDDYAIKLSESIRKARSNTVTCTKCQRLYTKTNSSLCDICGKQRDNVLMILPSDTDLDHVEKTGAYHGYYFVLGGTVPILEKEPEKKVRIHRLKSILESKIYPDLEEIILAFNANPEGDNTVDFLKENLSPVVPHNVVISTLARGLSTGSELEYSDKNTLDNALKYRIHEDFI